MTAILGFVELLAEGCPEDCSFRQGELREHLKTITRNGEHLLSIIDDILDLTKIEGGQLQVEQTSCPVCQLVSDAASLMRSQAEAKRLTLDVGYRTRIPETIRTDPTRLRQILINVLSNAVRFTATGGIRVEIAFEDGADLPEPREPLLRFDVIDTGIGMSDQHMAKVFKPFTQADETTTRKYGGTGLGLSISKRLASLLGGDIAVESRLGSGSTFHITVATGPLDDVVMIQPTGESLSCSEESRTSASGGSGVLGGEDILDCRILLAEDAPDNQRLVCFILAKAGAEVTVAQNGKIAVEKVLGAAHQRREGDPTQPYDLILMDMQMPVMDGYEATRALRRGGYTGPIVAVTAHAMSGDREKCLAAGCDEYLSKPVDRNRLVQVVHSHIARVIAVT